MKLVEVLKLTGGSSKDLFDLAEKGPKEDYHIAELKFQKVKFLVCNKTEHYWKPQRQIRTSLGGFSSLLIILDGDFV